LLDILKPPIAAFQDFVLLSVRAIRNIFRSPHYADDILVQMDVIGVGSLFIVSLIGLFSGIVMALQMSRALTTYGAQGQVGTIVSITLVRELGPVLTAILVAGRNASGIASELGSMKVTEQIDAMRALGTAADHHFGFHWADRWLFHRQHHARPDVFRILDLGSGGSGL
jgi:phospholipid/cholesterol/gamma-HCH transport system permease protein